MVRCWGSVRCSSTGTSHTRPLPALSTPPPNPPLPFLQPQWCGPCQILAGELDKVAGLYKEKLRVLKVDSDEEPRIASALKVYGLPTIFFIKVWMGVVKERGVWGELFCAKCTGTQ